MKKTLSIIGLLALFLVPATSQAEAPQSGTTLQEQIANLQKMVAELQAKLPPGMGMTATTAQVTEWQYDRPNNKEHSEPEGVGAKERRSLYKVKGEKLLHHQTGDYVDVNKARAHDAWAALRTVAGQPFVDKHIDEFIVFDAEDSSTLGSVRYFPDKKPTWLMSANEGNGWGIALNVYHADMKKRAERQEFVVTLIHEYGHILTLNDEQIEYSFSYEPECKKKSGRYFLTHGKMRDRGCAFEDSYISTYVAKFWTSKEIASAQAAWKTDDAAEYFEKNANKFVTWYATKNPGEDIAESFTDFIIMNKPTGDTIQDQKILFFYQYPELVQVRTEMRARIAPYFK